MYFTFRFVDVCRNIIMKNVYCRKLNGFIIQKLVEMCSVLILDFIYFLFWLMSLKQRYEF